MYGTVLKAIGLSALAQNHVSCQRCSKTVIVFVLSDVDFILRASNFDNFAAFLANFSYILTAHDTTFQFAE